MCDPSSHSSAISDWRRLAADSCTSGAELGRRLPIEPDILEPVIRAYPLRINPYYLGLIKSPHDPMGRQAVPDPRELEDDDQVADPLAEGELAPVPHLIHRYPDRVVLLAANRCAVYCRHCMRKRRTGHMADPDLQQLAPALDYIARRRTVRDVIISGGDPLMRSDAILFELLARIRAMDHVAVIRIHSRMPCTLPQRITASLAAGLARFAPVYLNTQFNHPAEVTPEAGLACGRLADAGIPLGCQTVLLKDVNDSADTLADLFYRLLAIRVRPYYLHHPDPVRGTAHLRPTIDKGLTIMARLRGHISGMAVPHYVIDLPGGGGKVPLLPESVVGRHQDHWLIRNYQGRVVRYPCGPA